MGRQGENISKGGVYITNSTGVTTDQYETKDVAMEETRMKQTVKLHIAAS